ncbi:MAG: 2-amino-4-hydroxy-6-hydroxymethyldihydropteridine diphosphokinase [Bacteroidales bacterium]
MHRVYLLFGGNQGDVQRAFSLAFSRMQEVGIFPVRESALYKSEPWGMDPNKPDFLNKVVLVKTPMSPGDLLRNLQAIEKQLGRERQAGKVLSRVIDLDILFYDDLVMDSPELTIPHPRLHLRKFTLIPLHEIDPGLTHPRLKQTVSELLESCRDNSAVTKISGSPDAASTL